VIIGAHSIVYSMSPEADRAFLRDVLKMPGVDVGGGWLIFGLPPAEVAVHPSHKNDVHEFYLMCDDVEAFITSMQKAKIVCGPVQNQGWGLLTQVRLPGGGHLGVYQPRHGRPPSMVVKSAPRKAAKRPPRTTRKTAARKKTAARSAKKRAGR
jgi:hypothetical protein